MPDKVISKNIDIEKTLSSLIKNGFRSIFFNNENDTLKYLIDTIKLNETVGVGGSKTIRELKIIPELKKRGNTVFDHWEDGLSPEEEISIRKKQMTSDVFLTGTNSITMNGEIVNREGVGNRINSMTFGPKRIFIIAGINKIVPDIPSAIKRIEEIAAPLRNKSLNTKNPCTKTGKCEDCNSASRICRITHILHRKPSCTDITVIIINREMGF